MVNQDYARRFYAERILASIIFGQAEKYNLPSSDCPLLQKTPIASATFLPFLDPASISKNSSTLERDHQRLPHLASRPVVRGKRAACYEIIHTGVRQSGRDRQPVWPEICRRRAPPQLKQQRPQQPKTPKLERAGKGRVS